MGVEIRHQGIGYITQTGGVRPVGVMAVATYAQHLGISLLELAVVLAERGDLARSTTGEVENVK